MSQLQTVPRDNQAVSRWAVYKRNRRAKFYAAGLTCHGKPRQKKQHPDLHGLNDKRLYDKLYSARYQR